MRKLIFILLVILCFVVESRFLVFGKRLNFTVLIAYYMGLRYGPARGLAWGAVIGLLADSLSGGMLGPGMLGKGTVGYMASFLTRRVFTWTPLLGFIAVPLLTMADGLISYASTIVFSYEPAFAGVFYTLLVQGVVNSPAGLFMRPGDDG